MSWAEAKMRRERLAVANAVDHLLSLEFDLRVAEEDFMSYPDDPYVSGNMEGLSEVCSWADRAAEELKTVADVNDLFFRCMEESNRLIQLSDGAGAEMSEYLFYRSEVYSDLADQLNEFLSPRKEVR